MADIANAIASIFNANPTAEVSFNPETGEIRVVPAPRVPTPNLAKALVSAQAEMNNAKKSATNPHLRNKYADLGDVIDAIRECFGNHGLGFMQEVTTNERLDVIVTTTLVHESGEERSSSLRMSPIKGDPQGIGSCATYARRYSLQAMAGLACEDDDGNDASNVTAATAARKDRQADKPAAAKAKTVEQSTPPAAPAQPEVPAESAGSAETPTAPTLSAKAETAIGIIKGIAGERLQACIKRAYGDFKGYDLTEVIKTITERANALNVTVDTSIPEAATA